MDKAVETYEEYIARWEQQKNARAEASGLFNSSTIDRVVTAVSKPLLDRAGFVKELERAARIHSFWHVVNDQLPNREVRDWLESLVSGLRRARTVAVHPPRDDPDIVDDLIFAASHDRHDISQLRHAFEGLQVLEATFGRLLRDKSYGLGRIRSRNAATHWLIGEELPRIYEQHFGEKFGYSRDKVTGIPYGPGMKFILEVLSIMDMTTSRDSIPFGAEAVEYYLRSAVH